MFFYWLASGLIIFNSYWTTNDFGLDCLSGQVSYYSFEKDADFIQTAQVLKGSLPIAWHGLESNRNLVQTSTGVFIDHLASNCIASHCSPFYLDHWKEGFHAEGLSHMEDYPYGWTEFDSIHLETCVISRGKTLGCVSWGGEFPVVGNKVVYKPVVNTNSTNEFNQALNNFKSFYKLSR